MISLKAKVDGREISLSQYSFGLEQAIYKKAAESVRTKLDAVKCPEHGKHLDAIVLNKAAGGSLNFTLEGCCQKLIDACEDELA